MLCSGRFVCKKIDSIPKVFTSIPSLRYCSNEREEKIVIPKRIERGPTDILRALASTVNLDPTAFHYKYQDDPHFYPYSSIDKKVYALSLESGRKSAKWIIKENPKFFEDQLADPPITAFDMKNFVEKEIDISEQGLLNAIEERNVSGAIDIYNSLKSKEDDVQKSTKQSLLELVCFYNSEDRKISDLEEKWLTGFLGKAGLYVQPSNPWINGGFAESLFEEMDPDCPLALSALIQGKIKHKRVIEGYKLFEEARAKNIKLPVSVYNAVLAEGHVIQKRKSEYYNFIRKHLSDMLQQNIKPNLGTLNSALKLLSTVHLADCATKLIKEFLNWGVQPSLATYSYLFQIIGNLKVSQENYNFYKNLAYEVFYCVENKEHEILDPYDMSFFCFAMELFHKFQDVDAAMRLHNMYLKPCNRKFIVKGSYHHGLYKELFQLVFKSLPLDQAMSFYRKYVFTVFSPESKTLNVVLTAIQENAASEYFAEFWEDLKLLKYTHNRPFLANLLNSMENLTDESSLKVLHEAALCFFDVVIEKKGWLEGDDIPFPTALMVLLKNDDEKALEKVLLFLKNNGHSLINIKESIVQNLFDYGMTKQNIPIILGSLFLASSEEMSFTGELVKQALPLLTEEDEAWANAIAVEANKNKSENE